MPNLLAHVGAQGLLSRLAVPHFDVRWILLGCLIPDVPWILQRMLRVLKPPVDLYDLRLYGIVQSSLFMSLILCATLALLSAAAGRIFLLLGANSMLHLLLDGLQTKWGSGVHLLAPFDWRLTSWRLFWPESLLALVLTASGLAFAWWAWRSPGRAIPLTVGPGLGRRRLLASVTLLLVYLLLPLALLDGPASVDSNFVDTLRHREVRIGRYIELDRVLFDEGHVGTFAYEDLEVRGVEAPDLRRISIAGRFVEPSIVDVEAYHLHWPWYRDAASYAGLALVGLFWVLPAGRRRQPLQKTG